MWYVLYREYSHQKEDYGYKYLWKKFNFKREAYEWVQENKELEIESIFYQAK